VNINRTPLHLFPFGSFQPDAQVRAAYDEHFCLAHLCPLPERLPAHHPLLDGLCGTLPIEDAPAPWWPACVASMPEPLRPLLCDLSAQSFRRGTIDGKLWRAFKQAHAAELKTYGLSGPRLQPLLARCGPEWQGAFLARGPASTPAELQLTISTQPPYIMGMSNGRGWSSCQHLYKREQHYTRCLPANLYDVNMAVAMLLPRGEHWEQEIWNANSILARTTLRVVRLGALDVVTLGRVYHNNMTAALWLIAHLIAHFERHGVAWGVLVESSTEAYFSSSYHVSIAPFAGQWPLGEEEQGRGYAFWLPYSCKPPYIDAVHSWRRATSIQDRLPGEQQAAAASGRFLHLTSTVRRAHARQGGLISSQFLDLPVGACFRFGNDEACTLYQKIEPRFEGPVAINYRALSSASAQFGSCFSNIAVYIANDSARGEEEQPERAAA
jgi:hypothetical protein